MTTNALQPPLPATAGTVLQWTDLSGAAAGLAIANAAQQLHHPVIVVTPDIATANRLYNELKFFSPHLPLLLFPDWETLPYDHFSPHHDIISERLRTLYRLPSLKQGIVLVDMSTVLQKLPPRNYIEGNSFIFQQGETLDSHAFRERLQSQGYQAVDQVIQHGEFAVRGSLLDVYPMGSELPYRLDLLDAEIDSIRTFDPETQRSLDTVKSVNLLPAHEFPLDETGVTQFRQQWRSEFAGNPANCPLYNDISQGFSGAGVEYYLPLFFKEMASFFDYFPAQSRIVQIGSIQTAVEKYWHEVNERY